MKSRKFDSFSYKGSIQANASKSHLQRIFCLGALSNKELFIEGLDPSDLAGDIQHVMGIVEALGFRLIQKDNGTQLIPSENSGTRGHLKVNVGESGFALRTMSSILHLFAERYTISGKGSLLLRDHSSLHKWIQRTGLSLESGQDGLPLKIVNIKGLLPEIHIDASESSQFLSGLLMAGLFQKHDTSIHVSGISSRPYVDLTLQLIEEFNGRISNEGYKIFRIEKDQSICTDKIKVEGDWSSMAFHLVGAALSGEIEITGLKLDSMQADRLVLEVLGDFGAEVHIDDRMVRVRSNQRMPFDASLVDAPDLFPVLSILACGAVGKSRLEGIHRLENKESNRLHSICEMLEVFQVDYAIEENQLLIHGKGSIAGGSVKTYNDHRIAMAAVTACTISNDAVEVDDVSCMDKSYPNYLRDVKERLKIL